MTQLPTIIYSQQGGLQILIETLSPEQQPELPPVLSRFRGWRRTFVSVLALGGVDTVTIVATGSWASRISSEVPCFWLVLIDTLSRVSC